jgi:hypothetical protein
MTGQKKEGPAVKPAPVKSPDSFVHCPLTVLA